MDRCFSLKYIFWLFVTNISNKGYIQKAVPVQFAKRNWLHTCSIRTSQKIQGKENQLKADIAGAQMVFSEQVTVRSATAEDTLPSTSPAQQLCSRELVYFQSFW